MNHLVPYDPQLPESVPSPCYVLDTRRLRGNMEILADVRRRAGVKMLAALKGFAMHSLFPLMRDYLDGVCASGPWEARLGAEAFGKEVHVYAPAFSERDLVEILPLAHHVSFNSFVQLRQGRAAAAAVRHPISCGLRVNPELSVVETPLYDPCAPGSRLGVRRAAFEGQDLEGVEGLHFHALCEQGADVLERMLERFEARFGDLLPGMRWANLGGGHHITSPAYDVEGLVAMLRDFKARYPHLEVYLEPGEALAINAGVLVATVLDVLENGPEPAAILDVSATCHMPDVLEMPYRPEIWGAGAPGEKPHAYQLGGLSCLAGDVIGRYAFDEPLRPGQRLHFLDMAHYTMVKTTTFNGIKHPAIAAWDPDAGELEVVRSFRYEDYRDRLS